MKAKLKLFLKGVGSVLNIYPSETEYYKRLIKKIESDRKKSDEELLKSDWEEIGKDFDEIIPR